MGQASRVLKERLCKTCDSVMWLSATELQEHVLLCKRATKLGLILPGTGLERPKIEIAMP